MSINTINNYYNRATQYIALGANRTVKSIELLTNEIFQSTVLRIESFPESYPTTVRCIEPLIYTLCKFANKYPILSLILYSTLLSILYRNAVLLMIPFVEGLIILQSIKIVLEVLAKTSILIYTISPGILAIRIYPELVKNHINRSPQISRIAAVCENIDPQLVSKLNTWADGTSELNRNWFKVRKKIINFCTRNTNYYFNASLKLSDKNLDSLPDIFDIPRVRNHLQTLNLSNNNLTVLPDSIGELQSLQTLNLSNNRNLSGLPQEILHLPSTCVVNISGCNFSQAVLNRLRDTVNAPDYAGPQISYSMHTGTVEEMSIEESFANLYYISGMDSKDLSELKGSSETLRLWLAKLSFTADYKGSSQQEFATKIIQYLEKANEDPSFREIFNATILDAVDSCGDRVALSVLKLGITYQLETHNLRNIQGLNHLLTRGVWALELLHEIARQKIQTLRYVDEIEVYLGYPVKLKEELNLPIDVDNMLYFRYSNLTPTDLDLAKDSVLTTLANEKEHVNFLIDQPKWIQALKLNYQEQFAAIEQKKEDALELEVENPNYTNIDNIYKQDIKDLTKLALTSFTR